MGLRPARCRLEIREGLCRGVTPRGGGKDALSHDVRLRPGREGQRELPQRKKGADHQRVTWEGDPSLASAWLGASPLRQYEPREFYPGFRFGRGSGFTRAAPR